MVVGQRGSRDRRLSGRLQLSRVVQLNQVRVASVVHLLLLLLLVLIEILLVVVVELLLLLLLLVSACRHLVPMIS